MDAFTDIGWFLYISLDSYKVWMHLQTFYQCVYCFLEAYNVYCCDHYLVDQNFM